MAATCGGVRVCRSTCPTGVSRAPSTTGTSSPGWRRCETTSPRNRRARRSSAATSTSPPTDDDVFDPAAFVGQTHVTAPERAALAELQALGLRDVVRDRWPDERVFTYWDYRAGMFHQRPRHADRPGLRQRGGRRASRAA